MSDASGKISQYLIIFGVLAATLAATFFAYALVSTAVSEAKENKLNDKAQNFRTNIEERLEVYFSALYSWRAFFAASQNVERQEFRDFFQAARMPEYYPDISSVAFAQKVPAGDKWKFIEEIRRDNSLTPSGYPNFTIYPDSESSEFYAIKYIEPLASKNKVMGFDYGSEAVRRESMIKARDTGLPQVTGVVASTATGESSISLLLAIYQNGRPVETVAQRQKAASGLVGITFNSRDFFANLIKENPEFQKSGIKIYDQIAADSSLIFRQAAADEDKGALLNRNQIKIKKGEVAAGDRKWLFEIADLDSGLLGFERFFPAVVAIGGFLISFLLTVGTYFLTHSRRRALALAEKITRSLKESEEKYKSLYESSADAIMMLAPPDWRFTAGNPATLRIFGLKSEKELAALDPGKLSPEKQPDGQKSNVKARAMIERAMKEGNNFFEWTHKKYRGEPFAASVLLTKIHLQGKELLQATVRDISPQKAAEDIMKAQKDEAVRLNKLMVGRELKMAELKQEITALKSGSKNKKQNL